MVEGGTTVTLSPLITSTCRDYFGRHVIRGGRKHLVDNRCDKCPLRAPCLAFGGAPANTIEQLDKARVEFERAAVEVLG